MNKTNKEIVQEVAANTRGLYSVIANEIILENSVEKMDQFVLDLFDQLRDAPEGLKKMIGKRLFNDLKILHKECKEN